MQEVFNCVGLYKSADSSWDQDRRGSYKPWNNGSIKKPFPPQAGLFLAHKDFLQTDIKRYTSAVFEFRNIWLFKDFASGLGKT